MPQAASPVGRLPCRSGRSSPVCPTSPETLHRAPFSPPANLPRKGGGAVIAALTPTLALTLALSCACSSSAADLARAVLPALLPAPRSYSRSGYDVRSPPRNVWPGRPCPARWPLGETHGRARPAVPHMVGGAPRPPADAGGLGGRGDAVASVGQGRRKDGRNSAARSARLTARSTNSVER